MGVFVSPGVYAREWDFSEFIGNFSSTIVGMVGAARRGVFDKAVLVTGTDQLISTFGRPFANPDATKGQFGIHAALDYLRFGRQLYYVRVGDGTEVKATITLLDTAGTPVDTITLDALTEGDWANYDSTTGLGLQVVVADGQTSGTFKLQFYLDGRLVETHNNLVHSPSTSPDFVETRVNAVSKLVTATKLGTGVAPATGTFAFADGTNGDAAIDDADIIGVSDGTTKTGMQVLRAFETLNINLLAVPGVSSLSVQTEMLGIAENRGDTMAVLDPPSGLGVQDVADWHNAVGAFTPPTRKALNSNYGALYWPWVLEFDPYNQTDVLVPPSGSVLGVYANNDLKAAPWFAPAGLNRGVLLYAKDVEYSPDLGERDILYGNGNAVNPIVNFVGQGITVWGQRTLQRKETALDRVNVRRMILYVRKLIATASKFLVFEPDDAFTWRQFVNLANSVLQPVLTGRGIQKFQVICDASTNTPDVIDRNEMRAKILIIPTKAAEIIVIDFFVLAQGADFTEFTQINPGA